MGIACEIIILPTLPLQKAKKNIIKFATKESATAHRAGAIMYKIGQSLCQHTRIGSWPIPHGFPVYFVTGYLLSVFVDQWCRHVWVLCGRMAYCLPLVVLKGGIFLLDYGKSKSAQDSCWKNGETQAYNAMAPCKVGNGV